MKILQKILGFLFLCMTLSSCEFLDIVPDERPTEDDAFKDSQAAQRYLYLCYSYIPDRSKVNSLDFMTADEQVSTSEHEAFASFMRGNYTPSNPGISNWQRYYDGIYRCYLFLNNIDKVADLSISLKQDYIAQATFLIAYYHHRLMMEFGPVILVKELLNYDTPVANYLPRSTYDECVSFVCSKYDEVARVLPASRSVEEYGLATSVAAKALKARALLYAASPLFNGNTEYYADFKNKDGQSLMPLSYDASKWELAKQAMVEAIDFAEKQGYSLYKKGDYNNGNAEPLEPLQHCLRYVLCDAGNSEILWANSLAEGSYSLQNSCVPNMTNGSYSNLAPTLSMIDRFYTSNGLPIEVDPDFNVENKYKPIVIGEEYADVAVPGEETLYQNLGREPRFYSWIAFQGGFYEVASATSNGAYSKDPSYLEYSHGDSCKLVCDFIIGGNCSRGKTVNSARNSQYSMTCYLNKKGVDPANQISASLKAPISYPWPVIRLADLYLGAAEACVETNDLDNAKRYLNQVRERAGIPNVEVSWEQIAGIPLNQERMREIVRRERLIEFYLENQQFWDVRRWKIADQFLGVQPRGLNTLATSIEELGNVYTISYERNFSKANYLMPIPLAEVNKNPNLVQNPYY